MSKIKDNYTAEIIITLVVLIMLLNSCSFNNKAEAMPPVHTLYHGLSEQEQAVYNSFNAEERANVNKNTEMHQLRQALDTIQYRYDY
jgi:hypothetical protein